MTDIPRIKREGYNALLADYCELADTVAALVARVAKLEAQQATPDASTATPNQAYTWIPGDAWSAYTAAMDGPDVVGTVVWDTGAVTWTGAPPFVHSPGYEQEEATP
jgi:hypothetical protein